MYIKENTSNVSSCVPRVAKGGGGVLVTIHAQNLVNLHVMCIQEKTSNNCSVNKVSWKC